MTIKEIESLTYEEAKKLSTGEAVIKDHQVLFADLGQYFGYSVLVFKDGHHICYANDYELHHGHLVKTKGKGALKEFYIQELNNKLFTDEELLGPVASYDEYQRKDYFLRNYRIMRYDCLSAFFIGDDQEKELDRKRKNYPYYNPVSFCYMKSPEPVDESVRFSKHLEATFKNLKEDSTIFREMVSRELANHEACVTCTYKDALDALGLKFSKLTEVQKQIVHEELRREIERYDFA